MLAWQPASPRDWWLLVAAAVTLVERVGTLSYFIPTAIWLLQPQALATGRAPALAARWAQLNLLRALLALAGWLFALRALSLTG